MRAAATEAPRAATTVTFADPAFDKTLRTRLGAKTLLCGVDEAGRGPLAGPVVAAAVILNPRARIRGLADSKLLTPEAREALYLEIVAKATVAVAFAAPERIDRLNIRGASLWAMARAVASLTAPPGHVLVDGRDVPDGIACRCEAVVGGDRLSPSIAAASIVAKVARDRMMVRLGTLFPDYGFEHHKGYATDAHLCALLAHGPTVHHRKSFAPVRELLEGLP